MNNKIIFILVFTLVLISSLAILFKFPVSFVYLYEVNGYHKLKQGEMIIDIGVINQSHENNQNNENKNWEETLNIAIGKRDVNYSLSGENYTWNERGRTYEVFVIDNNADLIEMANSAKYLKPTTSNTVLLKIAYNSSLASYLFRSFNDGFEDSRP